MRPAHVAEGAEGLEGEAVLLVPRERVLGDRRGLAEEERIEGHAVLEGFAAARLHPRVGNGEMVPAGAIALDRDLEADRVPEVGALVAQGVDSPGRAPRRMEAHVTRTDLSLEVTVEEAAAARPEIVAPVA